MANLNKVFLMGNLTRDPELKSLGNGSVLCQFGMAINRSYRTNDGINREETCFVDVTFWGKAAEITHRFLRKGRPIFVEGRLKYERWEGPDGRPRSKLSVVGENFQFIGTPPSREGHETHGRPFEGDNYPPYPDYGSTPTSPAITDDIPPYENDTPYPEKPDNDVPF